MSSFLLVFSLSLPVSVPPLPPPSIIRLLLSLFSPQLSLLCSFPGRRVCFRLAFSCKPKLWLNKRCVNVFGPTEYRVCLFLNQRTRRLLTHSRDRRHVCKQTKYKTYAYLGLDAHMSKQLDMDSRFIHKHSRLHRLRHVASIRACKSAETLLDTRTSELDLDMSTSCRSKWLRGKLWQLHSRFVYQQLCGCSRCPNHLYLWGEITTTCWIWAI